MKKSKKFGLVFSSIMLMSLIIVGIAIYQKDNSMIVETEGQAWTGKKNIQTKQESETIAIPGFESMTFVKDEKKQSVNFYNPDVNTCYFKLSLLLSDGTQIWESKLIEPGNGIYDIELNQFIDEGIYEDTILKYQCYAMNEEQTQLNGSEIKFKLQVI